MVYNILDYGAVPDGTGKVQKQYRQRLISVPEQAGRC